MPTVSNREATIGTMPVFWRAAPAPDGVPPPSTCTGCRRAATTGCPSSSATAASRPTCPASGAAASPATSSTRSQDYAGFIERFLDRTEVERVRLVVHDWGAVGLAFAQRLPERVERLVIVDAVPFLPGYRWHRTARHLAHRRCSASWRWAPRSAHAASAPRASQRPPGADARRLVDRSSTHFDQGTQRAILRLYRSSPPDVLAAAGARPRQADAARARAVGRAGPVHPLALRPAPTREALGDAPSCWSSRRRALAVARPPDVVDAVADFLAEDPARGRPAPPALCRGARAVYLLVDPPSADLAAQIYRRRPVRATTGSRSGTTAGTPATTSRPTASCSRRSAALLGPRRRRRARGGRRGVVRSSASCAARFAERGARAGALWFAVGDGDRRWSRAG